MRALRIAMLVVMVASLAGATAEAGSPGSILLKTSSVASRSIVFDWTWKRGSSVDRRSVVRLQTWHGSRWETIRRIRITKRKWTFSTWDIDDGVYRFRALIEGTSVRSRAVRTVVDRRSPEVVILRPQGTSVNNSGDEVKDATTTVIVGRVTLEAGVWDNLDRAGYGPRVLNWLIRDVSDGTHIVLRTLRKPISYDFGGKPGRYTITAYATDRTGNTGVSKTVEAIALPAPGEPAP